METGCGGVQHKGGIWFDARIVPTRGILKIYKEHMIREDLAEP
jgi:hypothetical protein